MASIDRHGTIYLWDVGTLKPIGQLLSDITENSAFPQHSLVFSPDGKLLASDYNQTTILWDVAHRQPLIHGLENPEPISSLVFSQDGQMLAAADTTSITLFDVSMNSWQVEACSIANRNLTLTEWIQFGSGEPYLKVCPHLPVHESVIEDRLVQAEAAAQAGRAKAAAADYSQVSQWAIQTDDANLNARICWYGSIDQYAKLVLPSCERAIELDPGNGNYYNSRGLARALLGNIQGTIADFTFFVQWAKKNYQGDDYNTERQGWIRALQAGENPFNATLLAQLRKEK